MVTFAGDLDLYACSEIRRKIDEAIALNDEDPLLVDVTEVRFMDSAALGVLVFAYRALSLDGRRLQLLVAPDSTVEYILTITGLYGVFVGLRESAVSG